MFQEFAVIVLNSRKRRLLQEVFWNKLSVSGLSYIFHGNPVLAKFSNSAANSVSSEAGLGFVLSHSRPHGDIIVYSSIFSCILVYYSIL